MTRVNASEAGALFMNIIPLPLAIQLAKQMQKEAEARKVCDVVVKQLFGNPNREENR